MLHNGDEATLSVSQIAAHLGTARSAIARELNLGAAGQPGRLRGRKDRGPGMLGRGGQWRVTREDYLNWLGVPAQDRPAPANGLPRLRSVTDAATELRVSPGQVRAALVHVPHLSVGHHRYLTEHQLRQLGLLLLEQMRRLQPDDYRDVAR